MFYCCQVFASDKNSLIAHAMYIKDERNISKVVIDFNDYPETSINYFDTPPQIVINLPETAFEFASDSLKAQGFFSKIAYNLTEKHTAKIILTPLFPAHITQKKVVVIKDKMLYRLILEVERISAKDFNTILSNQSEQNHNTSSLPEFPPDTPNPHSNFIIAIDPGHGGIDNGASGKNTGTPEKNITLSLGLALKKYLIGQKGITVIMTRETDEYLSLSQRVSIAHEHHADLFISIHADTLNNNKIRGATIYTLSEKSSDRLAANVAKRENLSELLSKNEPLKEPAKEPAEVKNILLDLTKRETQTFSNSFAKSIIKEFKKAHIALTNNSHRHATFQVLQALNIPSALLEVGFLSNYNDELLLLNEKWRDRIAKTTAQAIINYQNSILKNKSFE
ncbi:hypothetical protein RL73_00550 [Liberibacter crescens]|nr:hypothetical protein RL73_00550 [Liberibacter crescens]